MSKPAASKNRDCRPFSIVFALECLRRLVMKDLNPTIWLGPHELVVHPERETSCGQVHRIALVRELRFKGEFLDDINGQGITLTVHLTAEKAPDGPWDTCLIEGYIYPDDKYIVTRTTEDFGYYWKVKDVTPEPVQEPDWFDDGTGYYDRGW